MEINGECIQLCPRCSGLHIGFFIALIFFSIGKKKRLKFSGLIPKLICLAGVTIIFLEWFLAQLSLVSSTSMSRLITGLIGGSVLCILALLYNRSYTYKLKTGISFTWSSIFGVICLSLTIGLALFQMKSWTIITFILLCVVFINLCFVLHSILLRFFSLKKLKPTKT